MTVYCIVFTNQDEVHHDYAHIYSTREKAQEYIDMCMSHEGYSTILSIAEVEVK